MTPGLTLGSDQHVALLAFTLQFAAWCPLWALQKEAIVVLAVLPWKTSCITWRFSGAAQSEAPSLYMLISYVGSNYAAIPHKQSNYTIPITHTVIDLKVLVKSLIFTKTAHVMLGTLAKVFSRVRDSNIFIRESSVKVGCHESLLNTYITCKGLTTPAACGSGRRRVPENFGLVLV